jgi:hypothetical protein
MVCKATNWASRQGFTDLSREMILQLKPTDDSQVRCCVAG